MSRRKARQEMVFHWVTETFGPEHANSAPERVTRFFEEATELFQACGGDLAMAHKMLDFVFDKPIGDIEKELGDVGLMLLSVAAATGLDADYAEVQTVTMAFLSDPRDFAERNRAKNEAGFGPAYPITVYSSRDPEQVLRVREALGMGKPYSEQPFVEREIGKHPALGAPYLGSPCLCGKRREEDCKADDCEGHVR